MTAMSQGFESLPLRHKRNLFCLPRQERFFIAFWAKYRGNIEKSGCGAVERLLRSPILCFQRQKQPENAGVLIEFLCSVKKEKKCLGGGSRTQQGQKYIRFTLSSTILSPPLLENCDTLCYNEMCIFMSSRRRRINGREQHED